MSQIPSISENRARAILTKYKLADIVTGAVTEAQLADIIVSGPGTANSVSLPVLVSQQGKPEQGKPAMFSDELEFGDDLIPSASPLPIVGNKAAVLLGLTDTRDKTSGGRRLGVAAAKNIIKYISIKDK